MELLYVAAGLAILSVISKTVGYIIIHTLFHVLEITEKNHIRMINRLFYSNTIFGNESINGTCGTGWHVIWFRYSIIIIDKNHTVTHQGDTKEKLTIYFPRILGNHGKRHINGLLHNSDNRILKRFYESFCPWRDDSIEYPNGKKLSIKPWQTAVTSKVANLFALKKNVSVLLIGQPRKGKSTTAWFIAKKITEKTPFGKVFIIPIDFTVPGRGVLPVLDKDENDCIIILRDECEDMYKKATTEDSGSNNKEFTCWAEKKASLNTVEDFLLEQTNLILLDTTNVNNICDIPEYTSFIQRHDFIFILNDDDTLECLKK